MLHKEITEQIIDAFYKVYNSLGFGFLESVYEQALKIELASKGLEVDSQVPINVKYKKQLIGEFYADLLVESKVIIELKASGKIVKEHEYQLINYLKATDIEVGLLLNFGRKPSFRRKIFSNNQRFYLEEDEE